MGAEDDESKEGRERKIHRRKGAEDEESKEGRERKRRRKVSFANVMN